MPTPTSTAAIPIQAVTRRRRLGEAEGGASVPVAVTEGASQNHVRQLPKDGSRCPQRVVDSGDAEVQLLGSGKAEVADVVECGRRLLQRCGVRGERLRRCPREG